MRDDQTGEDNEIINKLTKGIQQYLKTSGRCCIAIEGKAAAGKTTLAALLEERLDAAVIHMDDFFLPLELRSKERYAEPGGNVHYERFNSEVVLNLKLNRAFKYHCFNCSKMELDGWQEVLNKKIIIVEGAYSMHPEIKLDYDLRIFLDIDASEQERRILLRNGADRLNQFKEKWIPMELDYFKSYHIMEHCNLVARL